MNGQNCYISIQGAATWRILLTSFASYRTIYLSFKVQLPTSDNTEITAGGPKYIRGSCRLYP